MKTTIKRTVKSKVFSSGSRKNTRPLLGRIGSIIFSMITVFSIVGMLKANAANPRNNYDGSSTSNVAVLEETVVKMEDAYTSTLEIDVDGKVKADVAPMKIVIEGIAHTAATTSEKVINIDNAFCSAIIVNAGDKSL